MAIDDSSGKMSRLLSSRNSPMQAFARSQLRSNRSNIVVGPSSRAAGPALRSIPRNQLKANCNAFAGVDGPSTREPQARNRIQGGSRTKDRHGMLERDCGG